MSEQPLASRGSTEIAIGDRLVGPGHDVYVIAEAGVNHNGDLGLAKDLVHHAAAVGADAVKFQAFTADQLASAGAQSADYQRREAGADTQRELLAGLELPLEAFAELRDLAVSLDLDFLCTPFDEVSLEGLVALGVPALKASSGDLTHLPFLRRLAGSGLPLIISTGGAHLAEVHTAVAAVIEVAGHPPAVLHCTTAYPAPSDELNLRAIRTLADAFGPLVGYSDHSLGGDAAIAAVALGAVILEKHLTSDRGLPGPDHSASMDPDAFARMVASVRATSASLGDGRKVPGRTERDVIVVARRSVVAELDLPAGHVIGPGDVAVRRPGTGVPPDELARVIGATVAVDVKGGEPVSWSDLVPDGRTPATLHDPQKETL